MFYNNPGSGLRVGPPWIEKKLVFLYGSLA
jgi:hypothetical protein